MLINQKENMMINKMDHTIPTSPSLTNCRQTASYSSKLDHVILARRKRAELRRSKVLSGGENDTLAKRRRFENVENEFPYQSSVIGRRREMEDAISVELGFVDKSCMKLDFYGVYDGHGGSRVANACSERLFKLLASEIGDGKNGEKDWDKLMEESFLKMDEEVNDQSEFVGSMGSTAVVAVVGDNEIVVANCGDSRAVLARGGVAVPLSNDHKVVFLEHARHS